MTNRYSSSKRLVATLSGILIALSAGTNYAFSIYSVQLGQRLHLTATWLNAVGLAGNLGMYLSSPFVGKAIDRYGPTLPLLGAGTAISLGYGLLWLIFSSSIQPGFVFLALIGNLLAGIGSSAANSCAVTGIASVIEPTHRATAIGSVLAGYGLSAFFWTTIGSLIARSDTAILLALLSLGPSITILLGAAGYLFVDISKPRASKIEPQSPGSNHTFSGDGQSSEASRLLSPIKPANISGWKLAKELDFWMIFVVMSCCAGIALMIINNIGTMVAAIYLHHHNHQTVQTVRTYQAQAVSMISIFNCFGRVFAGTVSDGLKQHLSLARVWWLCWISILFLISQLVGYYLVDSLDQIIWLGGLVGFAYGNLYGTAPTLVLEWFGLEKFGTNFGYLNLSPLLSGQIFNISFGKIYDHHTIHRSPRSGLGGQLVCKDGRDCYRNAFLITIVATLVSLSLSIFLGFRRTRFLSTFSSNRKDRDRTDRLVNSGDDEATVPMLNSSTDTH